MPPANAPSTKSNKTAPISIGAAGLAFLVAAFVANFEGYIPRTYADPIGIPTACFGATGPEITPGRQFTAAECIIMLDDDLQATWAAVEPCLTQPADIFQSMSYLDLAFNVGPSAFCNSTLVRLHNEGAPRELVCAQLKRWTYAKGKQLPGLVRRREAAYQMCVRT